MALMEGQAVSSNYNFFRQARPRSNSASSQGDISSPSTRGYRDREKSLPVPQINAIPESVSRDLRQRSPLQRLQDWWVWELAGALFSLVCLSGVIAILGSLDGKPLSKWMFPIAPNAMISIFTTLAKASMLTAVASCIGQLKWSHFQEQRSSLSHFQHFDEASRGPLGAWKFLWHTKAAARLASVGAILTILALGIEPFAQQVVSFPLRFSALSNASAGISTVQFYNSSYQYTDSFNPSMAGAIVEGIYGLNRSPPADCPNGRCDFPLFTSLGMCSTCNNVTALSPPKCDFPDDTMGSCLFRTPSGLTITLTSEGSGVMISNGSGGEHYPAVVASTHIIMNSTDDGSNITAAGIQTPLSAIGTVKFDSNPVYLLPELTPYQVSECAFYLCEKTYENATVRNGFIRANPTPEKNRQLYPTPWTLGNISDPYQYLSFNVSDSWVSTYNISVHNIGGATIENRIMAPPPGRQFPYGIRSLDGQYISGGLNRILNLSGTDDMMTGMGDHFNLLATPFWQAPDLGALMANISTSMTDNMRTASSNLTTVQGTIYVQETYVQVCWLWLVLPAGIVLFGIAFLLLTITSTAKHRALLWKSSSLALLLHGISIEWDEDNPSRGRDQWEEFGSTRYLSQMEKLSKHYSVRFDPGIWRDGKEKGFGEEDDDEDGVELRVPQFVAHEKAD